MSLTNPSRRKSTATPSTSGPAKSDGRQKAEPIKGLSKYWTPNEDWEKDELGDLIYWIRQALGLVCGVIWGLIPLTGGIWLMTFLSINGLLVFFYYTQILRVDDEDFGGPWALMQEGFMPSLGLFLLAWILVYTSLNFP